MRQGSDKTSIPPWRWLALTAILLAAALWLWRGSGLFPGPDRTWEAMQARGTWRVGMDPAFPPFESLDASGAPVGFDVELARQMAAGVGAASRDRGHGLRRLARCPDRR